MGNYVDKNVFGFIWNKILARGGESMYKAIIFQ